eukprot:1678382-Amphidinium_carterae.1
MRNRRRTKLSHRFRCKRSKPMKRSGESDNPKPPDTTTSPTELGKESVSSGNVYFKWNRTEQSYLLCGVLDDESFSLRASA